MIPLSGSIEYLDGVCTFNLEFPRSLDALTWSDDRGLNVNDQELARMSNNRIHVDGPIESGTTYIIEGDQARYVSRVRRMRSGDQLVLFDGGGDEYPAVITSTGKNAVHVEVGQRREKSVETPLSITLVQGLSRGDRMDHVIQKATEVGVSRIIPVSTEFSVVRLDGKRASSRVKHWRGVAASACEQCGRNRLPEIDPPDKLLNVLGALREEPVTRIVLQPGAAKTLRSIDVADVGLVVLIGPEGGFSDQEIEHAGAAGFDAVSFGPRILRTETAAVAVLTALQTLFGDLA